VRQLLLSLIAALLPFGAAAQDSTCKEPDNRNWVQGDSECLHIRTFTRDVKSPNPVLMVYLHGDKSSGAPLSWELNYSQQFMSADVAAVTMVRPGYPTESGARSSGNTQREDHYTDHNVSAVAGALKRLKNAHKARKLVVVGHSGGSAVTGVLFGKFPGLADAIVLLSCPCDVANWRNSQNKRAWPRSLSPSDFTANVPMNGRVLAMTGSRDTNTDERLARNYVVKLKGRGVNAVFRSIAGADHDAITSNPDAVAAIKEFLAAAD
jgi:pimeloyl-ACP methyl ester carboxylesterase